MRYTLKAQEIADKFARKTFGRFDCFSALYDGKLDRFPDALIFSPLFQGEAPALGLPQFILVQGNKAELVIGLDILNALMEKYEWPEEYDLEDGWTPPTQIKRFYEVKDEAERKAREYLESHNQLAYGPFLWEVEKNILRKEYHITWKPQSEIYFTRIY